MSSSSDPSACPVDHKARQAWLDAATAQHQHQTTPQPAPQSTAVSPLSGSCDSSQLDRPRFPSLRPKFTSIRPLSHDRQVSSIPRATSSEQPQSQPQPSTSPNAQTADPATSDTGHWIYPSESQFHGALLRKHGADAPGEESIPAIIPIHNAVNERTWREILRWESPVGGRREEADRPKLVSFRGDSTKLSPRARWYGLLGYQRPFDRHDWVVRRGGGEEVEYVIDYYAGKSAARSGGKGPPLSFYLDVRPKLNTVEGWKMRFWRFVGWG